MLKQETFYEVQSWGCVSALLGLPAELNPQMFVLVPDDVCNYTSRRCACQQFFENFLQQKIPAGRVPGGDREAEKCSFGKNYALACLTVEDLRSHAAQQHSGHHGEQGLGQHIAAVVGQAVSPCGQTIVQVAPH